MKRLHIAEPSAKGEMGGGGTDQFIHQEVANTLGMCGPVGLGAWGAARLKERH